MKPYQQPRKPKRKQNKMSEQPKQEATQQALPKWRQFVKDNKVKILAVIGVGLSAIGGDVVGITDFISAWFF